MGNDTPPELLAAANEAELQDMSNRRAAATPLPGALWEILKSGEIKIDEETTIRRVCAADWEIFQHLDSPVHQMMLESQKDEKLREEVKFDKNTISELCWQFSHPVLEVIFAAGIPDEDDKEEWLESHETLPAIGDAKSFRRRAKNEIYRKFSTAKINAMFSAVTHQFYVSNSTKIGFSADGEESKKK